MGTDGDALPLPIPAMPYQQERVYSCHWHVGERRHWLSGSCVFKRDMHLDLGQEDRVSTHLGCNMLLSGRGTYRDWEGRTYPLEPGSVFLRLPGRACTVWIDTTHTWIECYVVLAPATYRHLRALGVVPEQPVIASSDPRALVGHYRRIFQILDQATSSDASRALMAVQALYQVLREQSDGRRQRHAQAVERACRLLERDLHRSCDVQAVASAVGLSFESLRKAFRQQVGCSATAYHQRRRMDRACILLSTTTLDVTDIAARLGYSDAFAFSARFRKVHGCSPSAYRQGAGGS